MDGPTWRMAVRFSRAWPNAAIREGGGDMAQGHKAFVLAIAAGMVSPNPARAFYQQTDLVSDLPGVAQFQDPDLVNPWGMSASPTSFI